MKAVIYENYGSPDVLQLKQIEKPSPKDNEVLIRVYATAVNSGDVRMRKADPFAARFMLGLLRPRKKVLGVVFAGKVEAAGKAVTQFKIGDNVYGSTFLNFGAYAEYICLPEDGIIAKKPASLSFEEAAVIPFGGNTALHFFKKVHLKEGQKLLIFGASGAIGTAAVQIAKYFGAEVTAVCSSSNISLMKSLGADKVIDYTKEDFSKSDIQYDVIFDTVGYSPFSGSLKSLKNKGSYLRAVHMSPGPVLKGLWVSMTGGKKVIGGVASGNAQDMHFLNMLIENGHLKPVIDRTYPIEQLVEAHSYVEAGHKKGNVAITV